MKYRRQNGFTLVELLVAVAISGLVASAIIGFFIAQQRSHTAQEQVTYMQQNIRAGLGIMSRELRMAGYNPTREAADIGFLSGPAPNDPNFPYVPGSEMLELNKITFAFDLNGDTDATDAGEIVQFALEGSELKRNGEVLAEGIDDVAFAFAYDNDGDGDLDVDIAGNVIYAIAGADGTGPLDDASVNWHQVTDDGSAPPDTGTNAVAGEIRAVKIWLLAQIENTDPNYLDSQTYIVGTQTITPNDNRRHRLLDTVVSCRNMGL